MTEPGPAGRRALAARIFIGPAGSMDPTEWTYTGWTDQDGLVYPDGDPDTAVGFDGTHVDPATTAATAGHGHVAFIDDPPAAAERGDILAAIDAAVDQLCACGCGRRLDPDGPSGYFASQACQRGWHSAQATDAQAVYRRPDAADVYVGADEQQVPLHGSPVVREPVAAGPPEIPGRAGWHWLLPACPDLYGMGYRRVCAGCGPVIPRPAGPSPGVDIRDFANRLRDGDPAPGSIQILCPSCLEPLAGPVLYGTVDDVDGNLRLRLHSGDARAEYVLTRRQFQLRPLADLQQLADRIWPRLETQMAGFQARWTGARTGGHH
jgi:hypothetical protein